MVLTSTSGGPASTAIWSTRRLATAGSVASPAAYRSGPVQVHRQEGERSSPDSGDLAGIDGGYADRVPGRDGAITDMSAVRGDAADAARSGLIDRHDLVATLDRAAGKRVTIVS